MSELHPSEPDDEGDVELISDGENLLVFGDSRQSVERFLRAQGLLEKAVEFGSRRLVPALRASAAIAQKISDAAAESGLWVKLTPESAESIKKFGLTESGVPGVAHAMAGARGSIKKWIQIDTTARAKATNPAAFSGVAGALAQAAREQEAVQLRHLLEALDQKMDQVLRGQRDDILGDLAGIEREIRSAMLTRKMEGAVDGLTWSRLAAAPLQVRQVQSKAILKLGGIADDLERKQRVGDLNAELQRTKDEVRVWLSAVVRSAAAQDELAILELTHYASLAPDQVNNRRLSLDAARREDQAELYEGIAGLIQRMDKAADNANQNKILHTRGVPKAIRSIEDTKTVIKTFYDAVGVEIDWENIDPTAWFAAVREWRQWKNALAEARNKAWEKGKPILATVAVSAVVALVTRKLPKGPDSI